MLPSCSKARLGIEDKRCQIGHAVLSFSRHSHTLQGDAHVASRDGTATLREAGYINKSLAFLEQVVVALGDDKPRLHIPYRSSKLTHALKDALGGTCRTTLIACVWPSAAQADQTRATLRFAARMGRITCAPVVGRRRSASEDAASKVVARKLRNEVAVLRAELAARDLIRGAPPPAYAYGPLTDGDEVQKCVKLARAYVDLSLIHI